VSSRLGEFGVSPTVREQRISFEISVVDWCTAYLATAVRAEAKAFEGTIDVVQRRFDRANALVRKLTHVHKSTGDRHQYRNDTMNAVPEQRLLADSSDLC
jgi:hypothetical protein